MKQYALLLFLFIFYFGIHMLAKKIKEGESLQPLWSDGPTLPSRLVDIIAEREDDTSDEEEEDSDNASSSDECESDEDESD
jgi:hypothetical protein